MLQIAPRYLSATVTLGTVLSLHQVLCRLQALLWNDHPMSRPLSLVTQPRDWRQQRQTDNLLGVQCC